MASEQSDISDGPLAVRTSKEGDVCTIFLRGELDLANTATAEAALQEALDDGSGAVVVDLTGLEFIDSTGIALLVTAVNEDGAAGKLRFRPSRSAAVTRVLQLTGLDERLPLAE